MTHASDFASISPELLADAFDALEEGIAIYNADEQLVAFNKRYKELLGPMADMIKPGMNWRDLIHGCVQRGVVTQKHESGAEWEDISEQDRDTQARRTELRQLDGRFFELSYHPTSSGGFRRYPHGCHRPPHGRVAGRGTRPSLVPHPRSQPDSRCHGRG